MFMNTTENETSEKGIFQPRHATMTGLAFLELECLHLFNNEFLASHQHLSVGPLQIEQEAPTFCDFSKIHLGIDHYYRYFHFFCYKKLDVFVNFGEILSSSQTPSRVF